LRPLAAPEAAPVGRDDRPLLAKGIDNELKCLARIQPSMQQENRRLLRRGLRAPARQMHLETTHPQCLVPRLPQRLVRGYAVQSVQVLQAATD
jgi:hypothetical protein